MGDELQSDRKSAPIDRHVSAIPLADIPLPGHRIDQPHPTGEAVSDSDESTDPYAGAAVVAEAVAASPSASTIDRLDSASESENDDDLLLQASQIADHLRGRLSDLNRREQSLTEQLTLLDQERRNVRLWVQEFEEEMQQRSEQILTRENELTQKIQSCEKLIGELESQERDLDERSETLNRDRAELRQTLDRELDADRDALNETRRRLESDRAELARENERRRLEHTEALAGIETRLAEDRERIRAELAAELDADRRQFEQQQAAWSSERDAEKTELALERENLNSAVERTRVEMDQLQSEQAAELQQKIEAFDAQMREKEREFQQQQAEQAQALVATREETERELASRREQLEQEQRVVENRISFQEQHLQKLRVEVDALQREQRLEHQQAQARLEQAETMLRLRFEQMSHFRELLELREESVARERRMLAASRRTFESETERDRQRVQADREAWEHERQAQRAEIRRQQDMLTMHAENLEARKLRLDQLRTELEETHRETLEARMAVDEAWAQLTQAAGAETANERVELSRKALSDSYRHLREALTGQRREVLDAQTVLQRQTDEFRKEREQLTEWIAKRDESLRLHEEQLNRESAELDQRSSQLAAEQEKRIAEKLETEEVIRDLLKQISLLTEASIGEPVSEAVPSAQSGEPREIASNLSRTDIEAIINPRS